MLTQEQEDLCFGPLVWVLGSFRVLKSDFLPPYGYYPAKVRVGVRMDYLGERVDTFA